MITIDENDIPIQKVNLPLFEQKEVEVFVKREDLIHPYVSGNKYRKLKYNILEAKKKHSKLLTFGGAYSNHILAVAYIGKISNINTIGIIRGEELSRKFESELRTNPILSKAMDYGMKLEFISRTDYREKNQEWFIQELRQKFGGFYLIPEGGTNYLAVKGCQEILNCKTHNYNVICCAVGTGGTIAGIINNSQSNQKVIGFAALKQVNFLISEIEKYIISTKNNWKIYKDDYFGGYAKYNDELIRFINDVKIKTSLSLDPIYTGKMFYKICKLIECDTFDKGMQILMIHTGGMQSIQGINQLLKKKNKQQIMIQS